MTKLRERTRSSRRLPVPPTSQPGGPTWELAQLYPSQGEWTEADYLDLRTNHLVELSEGCLEILPMPTHKHQMVVAFLYELLKAFANREAPGFVLFAPLRVRLWDGKFREPDIMYMREANKDRITDYWEGADLVMEVVSPAKPEHDWQTKRQEYAKAGIPEYWIVDLIEQKIVVLTLTRKKYQVFGEFTAGATAASKLLPGFCVSVDDVMSL